MRYSKDSLMRPRDGKMKEFKNRVTVRRRALPESSREKAGMREHDKTWRKFAQNFFRTVEKAVLGSKESSVLLLSYKEKNQH